jgi:hypothetical protein
MKNLPRTTILKRASCLALLLILALALSGIWLMRDSILPHRGEIIDRKEIETKAHIQFPPSAADIHAFSEGVLGTYYIRVRFSMNAGDLSNFLPNTLCTTPLAPQETQEWDENLLDWWKVREADKLQSCQGIQGNCRHTILIDMTEPDTYIGYVAGGCSWYPISEPTK